MEILNKIWVIFDESGKNVAYINAVNESNARFTALRQFPALRGQKFIVKLA